MHSCDLWKFLIYRIVQQLSAIVIQNYHVSLPLFFVSEILIMLLDWKFVKVLPFFGFLCFVIASVHKFDKSGYLHGNFVFLNVNTGGPILVYQWQIQDFLTAEFGAKTYYLVRFFAENCMKIKEIRPGAVEVHGTPFGSANGYEFKMQ